VEARGESDYSINKGLGSMLNISEKNSISNRVDTSFYKSFQLLRSKPQYGISLWSVLIALALIGITMFLPWTQNIRAKGKVTTISPDQRPQAIPSVISGKIEKWFVREGEFVMKGDTIAYITETDTKYFDREILKRTEEQLDAKSESIGVYENKVKALESQIAALRAERSFKLQQLNNKALQARNQVVIDSVDLIAVSSNLDIAKNQYNRIKELYDRGLKSMNDLQEKELKAQQLSAKVTSQENKLQNQRRSFLNLQLEIPRIDQEYLDKISKIKSDQQSAQSQRLESVSMTSKLKNEVSNVKQRQTLYYIKAPQSGYITQTLKVGLGEIVKAGDDLATIMPSEYDLGISVQIRPQDLPLIRLGSHVRLRFDGWPAIVISGWPETSTGIFSGEVFAIDQSIQTNGFFRVLIRPDVSEKAWPELLRVGTGADTYILLNNVPIWYELWRQLNGFPADYYDQQEKIEEENKTKIPLKKVK